MTRSVEIRDAYENNLQHVDLTIPRDSIVAVSYTHLTLPTNVNV